MAKTVFNQMKHSKVVGFVPTYNAENFLTETLIALAKIDYPNFKIIIGDDCSTDQTLRIAKEFAAKDERFSVVQNESNLGWLKNSEKLWIQSAADSDYCFINPHDDIPTEDFIKRQVSALEANPKASVCCIQMDNHYWDGKIVNSGIQNFASSDKIPERVLEIISRKTMFWWAAYHGIHRSEFVQKIIPFKSEIGQKNEFSMDLVWLMKMAFYGPFITIPETLLVKKYSKASVSNQWKHNFAQRRKLWKIIIQEILASELPNHIKAKVLLGIQKEFFKKGLSRLKAY